MYLGTVGFSTVAGSENSAKAFSDMLGDGRSVLWMLAGSSNSFSAFFSAYNCRFSVHFSPCEIQSSGRAGFWSLLMLSVVYGWFLMSDNFPKKL